MPKRLYSVLKCSRLGHGKLAAITHHATDLFRVDLGSCGVSAFYHDEQSQSIFSYSLSSIVPLCAMWHLQFDLLDRALPRRTVIFLPTGDPGGQKSLARLAAIPLSKLCGIFEVSPAPLTETIPAGTTSLRSKWRWIRNSANAIGDRN